MNVLIACEFSGVVRDAFRAKGHNAWSCDLLPSTSDFHGPHLEGDVRWWISEAIHGNGKPWDLIIAHPPCDHLAVSGARWFPEKRADGRQRSGIDFFMEMINAPCDKIAVENPVGIMSRHYRKPDQIIQPWQFGHPEFKATCLWLKGLPSLTPTNILTPPEKGTKEYTEWSKVHRCPPGPDRWKIRAKTYQGIADAMADQWG